MPQPPSSSPYGATPVAAGRERKGVSNSVVILLIVLVLVLGGGGYLFYTKANPSNTNLSNSNQSHTGTTNLTSTPQQTVTTGATPSATPVNQPTAIPTAQPTSGGAPNPYTHSGSLALDDALTGNNYAWDTGTNSHNASCQFTSQGLEVTQPATGFFHGCIAKNTDFTNFTYEVQVNMIAGDYAGITFCADKAQGTYYFFYIKPDGSYALKLFSGDQAQSTLTSNSSSAIVTGLPSNNVLAVVVQNGTITLFVNQTNIAQVSDATYTHGQIGVFTGNDTNAAQTIFSHARVWQ